MKMYRRSIRDLTHAVLEAIDRKVTAWANATDEPTVSIPEQRTRHTIRTACVKASADEWQTTYPLPAEAWLLLDAPEGADQ